MIRNKTETLLTATAASALLAAASMLARRVPAATLGAVPADSPLSPDERALHALNRLGYGPRPADAAAIAALNDAPRGFKL